MHVMIILTVFSVAFAVLGLCFCIEVLKGNGTTSFLIGGLVLLVAGGSLAFFFGKKARLAIQKEMQPVMVQKERVPRLRTPAREKLKDGQIRPSISKQLPTTEFQGPGYFANVYALKTVEHDNHRFIVFLAGPQVGGFKHHPDCPCRTNKLSAIALPESP